MDDGKSITAFSSTLMQIDDEPEEDDMDSAEEDQEPLIVQKDLPWMNDDDFVPDWYQAYDCKAPYSKKDQGFVQEINQFYNYIVEKYDLS